MKTDGAWTHPEQPQGQHIISVIIISADKKEYYRTVQIITLDIK